MFRFKIIFFFSFVLFISSCSVNSNLMFKENKNSKIEIEDSIPLRPTEEYKLGINDKISFVITSKNGEKLIHGQVLETVSKTPEKLEYIIKVDGNAELPIIGDVYLKGLSIQACEDLLETKYAAAYKQPFVKVTVTNKRVIVFPGNGSDAKVVPLNNPNTTLMEVLALAGGITDRGKANSIKLIRKVGDVRKIYSLDLSTLDGLIYADMIVQGNDYVYVEPTHQISREILQEVTPILSILSTAVILITVLTNLN
ncbi:MAG: polysaccharide biosynthesis/export family protein [Lishizhenia sp.]